MTTTISGDTGIDKVKDGSIVQSDLAANVAGTGPCFRAYLSVDVALSAGGYAQAVFNTIEFNVGNAFSVGTGRFSPAVPGHYLITANLFLTGTSGVSCLAAYIRKNGGAICAQTVPPYAGLYGNISCSCVVFLNGSTDYVDVAGELQGGSTGVERTGSSFSGCLLRAA